ncbi:hypothetical protein Syn8016DRAFT_1309 [Synechococcus sp. WH 8016]|nr:hypothetical protein Syn8016DRAFT_1309 [Synechococcus sp. WH 8016]
MLLSLLTTLSHPLNVEIHFDGEEAEAPLKQGGVKPSNRTSNRTTDKEQNPIDFLENDRANDQSSLVD